MKTHLPIMATAGLSLMLASVAWAKEPPARVSRVEVNLVEPENFTDFKNSYAYSESGRDNLVSQFTAHLEWLARTYVPEGAKLVIKFTDIDLAGDFEPWRGPNAYDVRIVKNIYVPRMTFDFQLIGADGKVLSEGHRELSDLAFQFNQSGFLSDPLRYDKQLLTDWMRSEFKRKN
jgi:hypothetical protein